MKVTSPTKFGSGIYVNDPLLFNVKVPDEGVVCEITVGVLAPSLSKTPSVSSTFNVESFVVEYVSLLDVGESKGLGASLHAAPSLLLV